MNRFRLNFEVRLATIAVLGLAIGAAASPTPRAYAAGAVAGQAAAPAAGVTRPVTGGAAAPIPTPAAAGAPHAPAKPGVLDFEGEVIEGQKKTPELFLQTEVSKPALDSVLYQRRDFNDYHAVDSRLRPRLSEPPGSRPRPAAGTPQTGAPPAAGGVSPR